eukprot:359460-Amphidinium_carterae.1
MDCRFYKDHTTIVSKIFTASSLNHVCLFPYMFRGPTLMIAADMVQLGKCVRACGVNIPQMSGANGCYDSNI